MMKKVCKLILLKKFTRLGKYCLSAIVFSMVAFSCNEEGLRNGPENFSGEEQEIIFSINLPSVSNATPQLRSIGQAQENTIKTIDLVAFRKDNSGSTFNYYYEGALASDNTPGESTQKCRVKVRLAKYEQEFVIITNAGSFVKNAVSSNNGESTSKEDFLNKLEYTLPGTGTKWNAISASNYDALPMWGETSATITQNTSQLSVSLLRMLAKIDVQLDETKLNELKNVFKIKSVRLYNTLPKGRIAPNDANIKKSGNNVSVTGPSLPGTSEKYLGPLVYQDFSTPGILDIAMKNAIYTFETKAPESNNPYGALEATCVVVGGIYGADASETYYRVDFLDKDVKFQDILRNHRYLVNIVSVTGPGYKTPDEAFHNKAVNMGVDILNWDENNIYDVVFDGQFYLGVSRDSISVSREIQDNTDLSVITDYYSFEGSTNGWYIEKITDNTTGKNCTWVDVQPKQGAPNELKNVTIKITEDNNTGKPRSATILFAAGRLRYPVTVYQSDKEKASITITFEKGYGTNPTEVIFPVMLGGTTDPLNFTVDWTPKTADLVIYKTTVVGIPYSTFNLSPDITGIISGGNGGKKLEAAIAPNAVVTQTDISKEPNYQRAMKLVFSVSNGINTAEKTVVLKHVYYGN